MGVMAINAQEICPLTAPEVADPFAVDACLPVSINVAVTLTAKPVGLGEIDGLAVGELQLITVAGVVTIKAPSFLLRMVQFDGCVFVLQLPLLGIYRKTGMAVTAGEDTRGQGRSGNGIFIVLHCRNGKTDSNQCE
jgi:hypothetical protein